MIYLLVKISKNLVIKITNSFQRVERRLSIAVCVRRAEFFHLLLRLCTKMKTRINKISRGRSKKIMHRMVFCMRQALMSRKMTCERNIVSPRVYQTYQLFICDILMGLASNKHLNELYF